MTAAQGLRALICDAANTISVPAANILVANWTVNTAVTDVPAWVGTNTFSCNLSVPLPTRRRLSAVAASEEATEAWGARELQQVQSNWQTFVASTTVLNTQSSYYAAAAATGQSPTGYMQNQLLSLGAVTDPSAQLPVTSTLYTQAGVATTYLSQVVAPQSVVVNDLIVQENVNTSAPLVIGLVISIGALFVAAILGAMLFSSAPGAGAGAAGIAAAPGYGSKAHAL